MKRIITGVALSCFLVMSAVDGYAQETMQAKKMEGHTWHQVVMVKFKTGMADSAMKIINNHFMKAGMKMESDSPPPQIMRLRSGEWDLMMVWTLNSIEDMEWEISPEDVKWWDQMVKQEGGEEKAMQLMQTFDKMVTNSTSYLATSQEPAEGETMGSNN